ncbi:hypothetical protein [Bosea sp. NBC_00550]|uniref:hypothetical protein n=1 Tax=Bosea sp. NBC_00550 TaxID=2969621 RepID=UPI00222E841B|nr:hypothetical protein [Bosea sp. NBC_00550]UZF90644.1 hypothetical protein NWE53_16020 [Bosea sp. NBC_00550]
MAEIEHATDKAANIYRRRAERRGLPDNGQGKIDYVIDLGVKRKSGNQAECRIVNRPASGAPQKELSNGAPERIRTSDPQIRSLRL